MIFNTAFFWVFYFESKYWSFGHCIIWPSLISGFWWPLWYYQSFEFKYECSLQKTIDLRPNNLFLVCLYLSFSVAKKINNEKINVQIIKRKYIMTIIMLSVNFFCNISSYDILAYTCIIKNYIALIYYAKIVHLLCQFHAGKIGFSAVC
jgi:hypothetical protein